MKINYLPIKIIMSDYYITDKDVILVCNSSSNITIYLYSASGSNDIFKIKNIGSGEVIVQVNGADTIDGLSSISNITQYNTVNIMDYSKGSWIRL
jgi:hypothetical protein